MEPNNTNNQSGNQPAQSNNQGNQGSQNSQPNNQPRPNPQQGGQQHQNQQKNNPQQGGQGNQTKPTPAAASPKPSTPEDHNRKAVRTAGIILAIVVILALIGNGVWKHKQGTNTQPLDQSTEGCAPGALFSTTGKPCPQPSTTDLSAGASSTASSTSGGSYDDAIHQYAGKLIVFNDACKPLQVNPTFAKGTRILIANNSTATLTISVAGVAKTLSPYHYFTVPLTTAGGNAVMCNGASATTINVQ